MKITWVNHASYIWEYENVKLITDPWLEGRAFNESWALLAETKLDYSDFRDITHIWFSHEHPDHFSPPSINKIPRQYRREITVMFQKTIDNKVIEFCKRSGFKSIIEIDDFHEVSIGINIRVRIGKVKNDTDSWLHIKTPDFSILNLNDCVFDDKSLVDLHNEIGHVDLLLTQFSFANWVGNRNDISLMKAHAQRKLVEIKKQISCFKPKYTIPFASFVWFCHEDNFHFNAHANRIGLVYDYIGKLGTLPLIFYPGDVWSYGQSHKSLPRINEYLKDYHDLSKRELTKFKSKSIEELAEIGNIFREKAFMKNNKRKLLSYQALIIHVTDLNDVLSLSYKYGLKKVNINPGQSDISFHSQNLYYCLKYDWGFDTILIAGTFQKPLDGNFQNFMEYQWVATLNNQGKRMKSLFGRLIDRLKLSILGNI
tara:strand:+ start:462 stop:1739 length:1278 start_codon:yes stop_codon:yes gene_type:complete